MKIFERVIILVLIKYILKKTNKFLILYSLKNLQKIKS